MSELQLQASGAAPSSERYTQQSNAAFEAAISARTAFREGGFFLPHLRPGMSVLDVGCGPGSITVGLAEVVAPGEVVGVDLQPSQVEQARARAMERGLTNSRFEVASAYQLPFPDASFDAAFAHVVLMHLREPVRALQEIHRVLRPGGAVGVRDPDFGTILLVPASPLREQYRSLRDHVQQHNGGDPFMARHHRRHLLEAGFERATATASVSTAGSPAECRAWAAFLKGQLQGVARTALAEGWADRDSLDAMAQEIESWAEHPDAFAATIMCEAIGWVSS
jgi:ubiquinone/menaquinone biosynthesis C-methylase UbiE